MKKNGCSCEAERVELSRKCDSVYEENIVSTRKITSFTEQSVILRLKGVGRVRAHLNSSIT